MIRTIMKNTYYYAGMKLSARYHGTNLGRYLFRTAISKLTRCNKISGKELGTCLGYVENYRCLDYAQEFMEE